MMTENKKDGNFLIASHARMKKLTQGQAENSQITSFAQTVLLGTFSAVNAVLCRPTGIAKVIGLELGVQDSYNVKLRETLLPDD